jgi:hypothetical protein
MLQDEADGSQSKMAGVATGLGWTNAIPHSSVVAVAKERRVKRRVMS